MERDQCGSVTTYGAFSRNGMGPILGVNGAMTGRSYRDMMVNDVLLWAQQNMADGWILQQDNDPKHTLRVVKAAIDERNVRLLDWPSQSPDLNPVEHVWEELGRLCSKRPAGNKDEKLAQGDQSSDAVKRLHFLSIIINEVVGDAMADLLVVESLLRWYGYSIEDWEQSLYKNAPNVQIKVPVNDRSKYRTSYEETVLLEPEGVQEKINDLVKQYQGARAFVRPSGTENIVRVYAEAKTWEEADLLGRSLADLIKNL
nr:Alpha-D-phosphohexomutase domain containing protein [Haemonchus contortus]